MYFETLVIKWNNLSEGVQQKLEQITGSLALISTGCNQVKALMLNDISFHYKLQKL